MHRFCIPMVAAGLAVVLAACTPTFNWRTQVIGVTGLEAMFPCKPDTVTRTVPIAGSDRTVAMHSCDAGGVTFAVAHAALDNASQVPEVLTAWRASALAGLQADPDSTSAVAPLGVPALPQLQAVHATGAAPGQKSRTLIGVWFGQGGDAFAAFVMAPEVAVDKTEPFFAGLRLR